jgi:PAS domain S-box-containing protein
MTAKSERMRLQYPKLISLLLVLVSMLAIVVLYIFDITFLYEPKYLLGFTNTIFTSIIPIIVAIFAARIYRSTGSSSVLLMGCGMLGFGLCAGSAGWLRAIPGGANLNVTIYNTGALVGSLCHVTGAFISDSRKSYQREPGKQKLGVTSAYSAVIMFAVLFSFATVQQVIPPFFVQGSGPTALRQIVLGLAIFFYAFSSLLFMSSYLRRKSDFFYWYSLCLAMLAVGLFAFYIERIVGSPIGWVGRASNYMGTIFSTIAILSAVRSGKSKGLPLEDVISGFFVDAEANYKSLVETASDAIISFDQENRVILWNPSAGQLFGYTQVEVVGLHLFGMIIPQEHANTLNELIETSQDMGSPSTIEIVGRHKNGGLFPIELSAFRRKLLNGWVTTCILRDITVRKRAEAELKRVAQQRQIALDSAQMGWWHYDPITQIASWDVRYKEIFGVNGYTCPNDEILARIIHPEDVPGLRAKVEAALDPVDPKLFVAEYRINRPDGVMRWIEAHGIASFERHGENRRAASFVGTVADITERKKGEVDLRRVHDELELRVRERTSQLEVSNKALMEYAAKLERLNEELQEFAYVASHDLQEPLRKIQTFCDMAKQRCAPVLDRTSQDYLDRVLNSASRMRQLLRDLLLFSRVATKPEPFHKLDLARIVQEASDIFEASIKEAGCQVEIEDLPAIEADESQMLRLFQNLIANALRFRSSEPPHIKVYGRFNGQEMCEILVKDNGIGFAPQFAERIFKPFQRLHGRKEYEGTGMGLAICRKIVERHGGHIRAESEPGKGSTFIIRLPTKQDRWEGM